MSLYVEIGKNYNTVAQGKTGAEEADNKHMVGIKDVNTYWQFVNIIYRIRIHNLNLVGKSPLPAQEIY